jgi:flagella basal body P-ring formation protein FlgA
MTALRSRFSTWLQHVALGVLALALMPLAAAAPVPGVAAAAEAVLAERFPDEAHRFEVRVLRTGGAVDETAPLRIDLPSGGEVPRGHTKVDVLARAASGWERTGWALLYVAHFDSVVVARRSVRRNDAVAPADLGTAWLETTSFHGEPLRAVDLAAWGPDLFADRPLREGRALRRGDLRPPFAADTGEAVTLHFQRGAITLELPCHAREPGFVGEEIRLYSSTTDATYRARLTAPGVATWTATL